MRGPHSAVIHGEQEARAWLFAMVQLSVATAVLVAATSWPMTSLAPAVRIPNLAGKILTVTGPVDPWEVGPTIMHEHIFIARTRTGGRRRAAAVGSRALPGAYFSQEFERRTSVHGISQSRLSL